MGMDIRLMRAHALLWCLRCTGQDWAFGGRASDAIRHFSVFVANDGMLASFKACVRMLNRCFHFDRVRLNSSFLDFVD